MDVGGGGVLGGVGSGWSLGQATSCLVHQVHGRPPGTGRDLHNSAKIADGRSHSKKFFSKNSNVGV